MQRSRTIQWNPYDSRLLGECLEDALADPPYGVGYELDPLRLVELVRRADQPKVALVDQIRERYTLVLIFLRDRNDEAEIRPDELVECFLVVGANALRESDFLLARDKRIDADVPKILIERAFLVLRFPVYRDRHTRCCSLLRPRYLCLTSAARDSRVH